jgi:hypothetical protein
MPIDRPGAAAAASGMGGGSAGEIDELTISWMLVTTLPAANFAQACQYLQWLATAG